MTFADVFSNFIDTTGFAYLIADPRCLIMIAISCVLLYLAIVKGFEPLLLVPIAFGMLLTNLPGANMFHLFSKGGRWRYRHKLGGAGSRRRPYRLPVSGRKARHIPLADIHGRGSNDRLRSPDCQPQEPAYGRGSAVRHLRRLYRR